MSATAMKTPPPSSAAGAALSTTRPKTRKLPIVRWVSNTRLCGTSFSYVLLRAPR